MVFAETLLPVEANLQSNTQVLGWLGSVTQRSVDVLLSGHTKHIPLRLSRCLLRLCIVDLLSFVVIKFDVKQLLSLAVARGIDRA